MLKKNNQNKSNKSNTSNKSNKSEQSDMDFLDACIVENKKLEMEKLEMEKLNDGIVGKSPLEKSLDEAKKRENKNKIKKAILMKQQMRGMPSKKEIETQQNLLKEMMKHPKMTNEILHLYGKAIEYNPTKTLPGPTEIFDNDEKYRIEYYQYILGIIDSLKEQKKDIKFLDKILDNPFGHYMSKCLGCPLNPFSNKTSQQQSASSILSNANIGLTSELPKDVIPIKQHDQVKNYDEISDDEDDV